MNYIFRYGKALLLLFVLMLVIVGWWTYYYIDGYLMLQKIETIYNNKAKALVPQYIAMMEKAPNQWHTCASINLPAIHILSSENIARRVAYYAESDKYCKVWDPDWPDDFCHLIEKTPESPSPRDQKIALKLCEFARTF